MYKAMSKGNKNAVWLMQVWPFFHYYFPWHSCFGMLFRKLFYCSNIEVKAIQNDGSEKPPFHAMMLSYLRAIFVQGWLFSSDSKFWKPPQMKVNSQISDYESLWYRNGFSYSITQPILLSAGALTFGSLWQNDSS